MSFYVGTAAWNLPKEFAEHFPAEGSHLERYAARLNGVEINSSFYREHMPKTYERWAESVPENFRFAVKISKRFTHVQKLQVREDDLVEFLDGVFHLGRKLGPILIQLPPSLAFDRETTVAFLEILRANCESALVLEPRHKTWLHEDALDLLDRHCVSLAYADPDPRGFNALTRRPDSEVAYFRLHGSPEMYKSRYSEGNLAAWCTLMHEAERRHDQVWCVFDNTTFGFATQNAVEMRKVLERGCEPETNTSRA